MECERKLGLNVNVSQLSMEGYPCLSVVEEGPPIEDAKEEEDQVDDVFEVLQNGLHEPIWRGALGRAQEEE